MKRTRMVLFLTFVFFAFGANANDSQLNELISKRFVFKKNEQGQLDSVKMKFLSKFSLRPYLVQIKNDIKAEIERMRSKKDYEQEVDLFIEEISADANNKEVDENSIAIRDALLNLKNVNVDQAFSSIHDHGVLKKFEFELKDLLKMLDLTIISNPNDARFFYRKNVTYQVVTRALNFAKKRFDNIPILNLVSFVIVKVHDLVLEQRLFHQNMLLHYLQNHTHEELGLTKKEVDFVMSSIYESRIAALNFPESNNAANNWTDYGFNKFFTMVRTANTRIRRTTTSYDSINGRYNYAFVEVVEKGERVVKNLIDNKHMFSSKAPTAYNYDRPGKVKRTRALLNLGQVGLGFLPIPSWLKTQAQSFIESFYVKQKLTEGALVAYFEEQGNMNMARTIKAQMINPYINFN
jgi:hypothetical protein